MIREPGGRRIRLILELGNGPVITSNEVRIHLGHFCRARVDGLAVRLVDRGKRGCKDIAVYDYDCRLR